MEYSNLFVCLMGVGTVFIGLICIIILVSIMSGIVRKTEKTADQTPADIPSPAASVSGAGTQTKVTPEMVAAVSAAIAQELGTDVDAIRIRSFKRA